MARRRMKRSSSKKSCTPGIVRFRTKRGKVISFKGRSGGQQKAGGTCSNKARRRTAWMRAFGKAGRACARKHKPGTKSMGACVKAALK